MSLRPPVVALLAGLALAVCGAPPDEEPAEPAPDTVATSGERPAAGDTAATLLPAVRNGQPMPAAERAGGVPPYPGAIVHTRTPRERPGMVAFEAFTPDTWPAVIAWYDSALAGKGWGRTGARDMVFYVLGDDEAAVTLSPWQPEDLPAGDHPAVLEEARTAIGVAWRTGGATAGGASRPPPGSP